MRQLYVRKLGLSRPGRTLSSVVFAIVLSVAITSVAVASTLVGHVSNVRKQIARNPDTTSQVQRLRFTRPAYLAIPRTYSIRAGDTLSKIAALVYGSSKKWPSLWWINKAKVHNPNDIKVGQELKLSGWQSDAGWIYTAALKAVPVTVQVHTHSFNTPTYASASRSAHRVSSVTGGSVSAGSSYERCVIARESGGNSQVMNSSGHYGLYQFSASTWQAYGGSASTFGHASASEQQRVFRNAMAQGGQSNWSPYDGC